MLGTLAEYPKRWYETVDREATSVMADSKFGAEAVGLHILLGFGVFLLILPVILAAIVSTHPVGILRGPADLIPGTHALENFQTVMIRFNFGTFMLNSFLMSIVIVVGKLLISLFAALAIVYYRVPYKDLVFLFILFTLMLPVPVRFVPLYELVTQFGWSNTFAAITIPYLASATTVFILRQHFLSISPTMVETAKIDGVGPLRFLVYVLIPMSRGVLVGVSVIMFVYAWNQYLWPLVIIDSQAKQVAQVGLSLLQGEAMAGDVAWALVMSGAIITLIPPLVLLVLFRKPLLETFTVQQK